MKKRKLDISQCANEITGLMEKGLFLTTKAGDKVNSMVVSWGHIGRIWERKSAIVYVRESRFTKELLDMNPEFTLNIPLNGYDKNAFAICGSKSGRDMDKITESNLTLVEPEVVSVPAIKEYPLTLECRVIYRQDHDPSQIQDDIKSVFYADGDYHTVYIGEIVDAYIIED